MDMHTLHVEHCVMLGLFTLLMVVNARLHRGTRGANWFTAFTACAFLGSLLIALRGSIPDAASIFVGNVAFSIGYLFLHRSLTEFFGRGRFQQGLQLAVVAICVVAMFRWGVLRPETTPRLLAYSLLLGTQVGLSAWFTLRQASGRNRWSTRMVGGLLALLCVNNLGRALAVMLGGAPANYLQGTPVLSWVLLGTSVLQGALTIGYVWMTAARLREELEAEATTDPLTQLLNRRALTALAGRELAFSEATGLPLSAIVIDLDDFKNINDVWGHHCGDTVLKAVAQCLQREMRGTDRVGRVGGDEFVVMLPRTSRYEATDIAERMRSSLAEMQCIEGDMATSVRASFGVAEMHTGLSGWEHLIQQCDKAMYRVKAQGGNQVLVH